MTNPFAVAAGVVGTLFDFKSKRDAGKEAKRVGKANKQAAYYEAEQLDQQAGQAFAVSQRQAIGEGRKEDLMIRELMAQFATGGPISPGQLSLLAQMEAQKAYNIESILASGKSEEQLMKEQAKAKRYRGDLGLATAENQQRSYNLAAGASLFSDTATLLDRYG